MRSQTSRKRGQIEIMGLVLIVIIISLTLLFAVRVVFKKKTTAQDVYEGYTNQKLVSSFVNAMLQTDSLCTKDTTVRDLLIDCAKGQSYGGSIVCSDGQRSCPYVAQVIEQMLDGTLGAWKYGDAYGYQFLAYVPPAEPMVNVSVGDFSQSSGGRTEPFKLPLYPSTNEVYVLLCIGGCV